MLAEIGSYTKTAQKMFVVPSTISKQIKNLETEIGRELVIRDKKSVRLTREGEILLEYASHILKHEEEMLQEINSAADSSRSLRIGAVPSLLETHIMDWIRDYMLREPDLRVSLQSDHSQILLNMLYDGELDLCIGYRRFRENNCDCIPFIEDEMILVTGGDNDSFPGGVSTAELRELPLIKESQLSVADIGLYREIFDRNENVVISISTGNLIIPFLREGRGYGFAVRHSVGEDLEEGLLRQIPIRDHGKIILKSYIVYKNTNARITEEMIEDLRSFASGRK